MADYKRYCELRDARKVKDADVSRSTGIGKSTFSDWKSGRSLPKNDKLQLIADYFNVSLDYLTGKTDDSFVMMDGYLFNGANGTMIPLRDTYAQDSKPEAQDPAAVDFLRNQNTIKLSEDAIDVAAQYATRPPEIQEMIRMLLKYSEHQS